MNTKNQLTSHTEQRSRLTKLAVLEGAASVRLDFGSSAEDFSQRMRAWNERIELRQAVTGKTALQCLDDEVSLRRLGQWGFFLLALTWLAMVLVSVHWQAPSWLSVTLALGHGALLMAPTLLLRRAQRSVPVLARKQSN